MSAAAAMTAGAPADAARRVSHAMRRARAAIVTATCLSLVAERFGVAVEDIRRVKGKAHAHLRYAVYHLATGPGGVPAYGAARWLGVERKAVMHGLARLPLARAGDALFDAKLAALEADIARVFPGGAA